MQPFPNLLKKYGGPTLCFLALTMAGLVLCWLGLRTSQNETLAQAQVRLSSVLTSAMMALPAGSQLSPGSQDHSEARRQLQSVLGQEPLLTSIRFYSAQSGQLRLTLDTGSADHDLAPADIQNADSNLASFVPPRNSQGHLTLIAPAPGGSMVVQQDALAIQGRLDAAQEQAWWGAAIAILVAALVTGLIYRKLAIEIFDAALANQRRRGFIVTGAQILLVAASGFVIWNGVAAQIQSAELQASAMSATRQTQQIDSLRSFVAARLSQPENRSATPVRVASPILNREVSEFVRLSDERAAEWRTAGIRLDDALGQELRRLQSIQQTIQADQGLLMIDLVRIILLAALASTISILLLGLSARQSHQLSEAAQATKRVEDDYHRLLDKAPIGLFTLADGKVTYANAAWQQIVGLPKTTSEITEILAKIHPSDRPALEHRLESSLGIETPLQATFRVMSSATRARHIILEGLPVFDENGEFRHTLAFATDMTENVEARLSLQTKSHEVEIKNRMLAGALEDLEANMESVVRCLVLAVEAKDPYTAGHSERVMQYSLWIGEELGLGAYEQRVLELGTLVHDIGKIGIPDEILTKPGRLTPEEFDEIKKHPTTGLRILEGIGVFRDCLPIVRWHHEKLDGTGYPDRLKGEDIPFLVRISTVADIFDAMTSTRAYRSGIDPAVVMKVISEDSAAGKLDPVIVGALEKVIAKYGVISQTDRPISFQKAA